MTVVLSLPSAQYTPRAVNLSPSVPAGVKKLTLSCTRESWPVGNVGSIAVTWPDGSAGPSCTFDGGDVMGRNGVLSTQSGMSVELIDPATGLAVDLPAGTYGVRIVILQTVTTALKVERF